MFYILIGGLVLAVLFGAFEVTLKRLQLVPKVTITNIRFIAYITCTTWVVLWLGYLFVLISNYFGFQHFFYLHDIVFTFSFIWNLFMTLYLRLHLSHRKNLTIHLTWCYLKVWKGGRMAELCNSVNIIKLTEWRRLVICPF